MNNPLILHSCFGRNHLRRLSFLLWPTKEPCQNRYSRSISQLCKPEHLSKCHSRTGSVAGNWPDDWRQRLVLQMSMQNRELAWCLKSFLLIAQASALVTVQLWLIWTTSHLHIPVPITLPQEQCDRFLSYLRVTYLDTYWILRYWLSYFSSLLFYVLVGVWTNSDVSQS